MRDFERVPKSEIFDVLDDYWRNFRGIQIKRRQPQQSAQMPVFSLDGELEQMLQSGFVCHAANVNQRRE